MSTKIKQKLETALAIIGGGFMKGYSEAEKQNTESKFVKGLLTLMYFPKGLLEEIMEDTDYRCQIRREK